MENFTHVSVRILEKEDTKPVIDVKEGDTVVNCTLQTFYHPGRWHNWW
jgi:hypothetical protein